MPRGAPGARSAALEWVGEWLSRLGDLAGLEAAGAGADMHVRAVDHRVDALEVREGSLLGLVVGVAHLVTDQGTLAADVALESHEQTPKKGHVDCRKPGRKSSSSEGALHRAHRLAAGKEERLLGGGARGEDLPLEPEARIGRGRGEEHALVRGRERPQPDGLRVLVRPQDRMAVRRIEVRRLVDDVAIEE